MLNLPDFDKSFGHENAFYLTCDITRASKFMAHYDLFKAALDVPGAIVECGVFKGASLARFAMYRELMCNPFAKKIIGFDTFDQFPETEFEGDKAKRQAFIDDAGAQSISVEQMREVLDRKGCGRNIDLIAGDIRQTVPAYVAANPALRISLLNIDVDVYEPSVTILEYLYPLVEPGGVVVLDDYGSFAGETKAFRDYAATKGIHLRKFPYAMTPCYFIKE